LCCVCLFFSCLRPVSCAWWCPIHIVLCLFVFFLSSSSVLCMVVSITYCVVFVCFFLSTSSVLCMVVSNTYCVVFFVLCFVYPMLPVSLKCPFLIAPLVYLTFIKYMIYCETEN
jgi:hypothetical protein